MTQQHVQPSFQAALHRRFVDALVVVRDSGGRPGRELCRRLRLDPVAGCDLALGEGAGDQFEQLGVTAFGIAKHVVEGLLQSAADRPVEHRLEIVDIGAFRGGREPGRTVLHIGVGGSQQDQFQRRRQELLGEQPHRRRAGHDRGAVEPVGKRGGALLQQALGDSRGVVVAVPLVEMRGNQARRQHQPGDVDHPRAGADGRGDVADQCDPVIGNRHIATVDASAVHVHHPAADQRQVCRPQTEGNVDRRDPACR